MLLAFVARKDECGHTDSKQEECFRFRDCDWTHPTAAQRFDERRLKAIIDRYFMMISRKFARCALINKHITCLLLFFLVETGIYVITRECDGT